MPTPNSCKLFKKYFYFLKEKVKGDGIFFQSLFLEDDKKI